MTGCRKKAFAGSAAAHQRGETRRLSLEIDRPSSEQKRNIKFTLLSGYVMEWIYITNMEWLNFPQGLTWINDWTSDNATSLR